MTQTNVAQTDGRSTMFYPGTFSPAEAQPIVMTSGQEVVGLTIQLQQVRHARLSGSVRLSDGRAANLTSVTLSNGVSRQALNQLFSAKGSTFDIPNVAPGDYALSLQTDTKEALFTRVSVAAADVALALTTTAGAAVKGRFVFDGDRSTVRPSDIRVSLTAAPALSSDAFRVTDDWTFESPRVIGSGLVRAQSSTVSSPAGQPRAMLKGVFRRGVEVTDTPIDFSAGVDDLEVVLTTRVSGVTGTVSQERRGPVPDATIVVFTEDRARWGASSRFVRVARSDQSGRFSITALPAGRYFAAALDFVEEGDEQDPLILEALRRTATMLTLADGETTSVDLRLEP